MVSVDFSGHSPVLNLNHRTQGTRSIQMTTDFLPVIRACPAGHKDIKTTTKYYTKVSKVDLRAAVLKRYGKSS